MDQNAINELKKAKHLLDKGIITEAEFTTIKAELTGISLSDKKEESPQTNNDTPHVSTTNEGSSQGKNTSSNLPIILGIIGFLIIVVIIIVFAGKSSNSKSYSPSTEYIYTNDNNDGNDYSSDYEDDSQMQTPSPDSYYEGNEYDVQDPNDDSYLEDDEYDGPDPKAEGYEYYH